MIDQDPELLVTPDRVGRVPLHHAIIHGPVLNAPVTPELVEIIRAMVEANPKTKNRKESAGQRRTPYDIAFGADTRWGITPGILELLNPDEE